MYLFAFVFVAVDLYCSNQYGWKSSGEICVLWDKYADNMDYIHLICSHQRMLGDITIDILLQSIKEPYYIRKFK